MIMSKDDIKTYEFQELLYLLIIYIVCAISFMIIFNKSSMITNLKVITGLFYLYVIPGFFIMFLFTDLNFIIKIILGSIVGFTLTTIISYYLNVLFDVSLALMLIIPAIIIVLSILLKLFFNHIAEKKRPHKE